MNIVKVEVNDGQCQRVGAALKDLRFRRSFLERDFISFSADPEYKLRAYLFAAAICHQTHGLVNKKYNLKGWELMEYVFSDLAKKKDSLLDPDNLVGLSIADLADRLRAAFSEDHDPQHCTLGEAEERAQIMKQVADLLAREYGSQAMQLLIASQGLLISEGQGLYERLGILPVFQDPAKKKSTVFVQFAQEAGLLKIKDMDNLAPPMDYHMQRVLLRTGCIEVIDAGLSQALKARENIPSDEAVRSAAVEAVRLLARYSERNLLDIDLFLWPLGRSCCYEKLLCADGVCSKSPCTLVQAVDLPDHNKCALNEVCRGASDEVYRKYWEPQVDTDYY